MLVFRKSLSSFALLSALLSARAQTKVQPDAPYSISGTVVNSVTDEPVAHALVSDLGSEYTMSDSNGRFRFDALPARSYMLDARKPGFFNPRELGSGVNKPILLNRDETSIVLKLAPEAVILGRVVNGEGEPLEGFRVRLEQLLPHHGGRRTVFQREVSTHDDGAFRIASLKPGAYYLEVQPGWGRAMVRSGADGQQGYRSAYYPGTNDISSASAITVRPGEHVEADFTLRPEPLYEVSGTVAAASPPLGASVYLLTSSGEQLSLRARVDYITGAFQLRGVPAGAYTIVAEARDREHLASARATLAVGADVPGVQLTLESAVTIPVVVRAQSSRPESSEAQLVPYVNVNLAAIGRDREISAAPEPGPRGPIRLREVEPGKYAVRIATQPPWYVQSAMSGSTDLLREDLTVAPGVAQPIEVMVRDDGAQISGSIMGANDESTVMVVAIPDVRSITPQVTFGGGQSPRFDFTALAPGGYTVLAFDSAKVGDYSDRDALRQYLSQGVHLSVSANDKKVITVPLVAYEERGDQ